MALLNEDLVSVREAAGLKPNDIFEKTRIPLNIIDEIERGTIFTNRNHQLTYIRSYVRSYAKAIGIHEDDIVEALDQHQADRYEGLLAQKYLHSEPLTDNVPDQKKSEDTAIQSAGGKPSSTATLGENEYSRPDPRKNYNQQTMPPPGLESVDWAGVGRKAAVGKGSPMIYAGLISILALIALLVYFLFIRPSGDPVVENNTDSMQNGTELPVSVQPESDTPDEPVTPAADPQPEEELSPVAALPSAPVRPTTNPVSGALPDTLQIVLHAAIDKLEPVRVTSDVNNVRSPYWIEAGQAMRFEFIDSIRIEGQLTRMAIWINGNHFADIMEYSTGDRTLELSREALSQYAELFSAPGDFTSQTIDSPIEITDRPLF
ncbi:MAG: helix-turn-helix domain protein [Bacteroidetes bacterium HLUCCA01]|nr:MAG: helix-turn-helix domain protein [Bacteroidetes bacterium HLUCCA01]